MIYRRGELDHIKQGELNYTQNRELSWLKFNDRVLDEAADSTVPLMERLKFIAIFSNNLDEFFMVRVGSLFDIKVLGKNAIDKKSGMTAEEQLHHIYKAVGPLYRKRDEIFAIVKQELKAHDIYELNFSDLEVQEKKFVKNYFKNSVLPILSPQIVDSCHPFPHLQNNVIHVGAMLEIKDESVFSVIPLPTALPPLLFLEGSDIRYIRMENILLEFVHMVFDLYAVIEKTALVVTRSADISSNDEAFDLENDFRKKMKKLLKQRRRLAPVRLNLSNEISHSFMDNLCTRLDLTHKQVFVNHAPMNLSYVFSLPNKLPVAQRRSLTFEDFFPQMSKSIDLNESIIRQIERKDLLIYTPYESMEPFLKLVKESASDPQVISIKITIYRLANKAKIVDYLCAAAENGKDVTVLIELRARFDEQNNIDWSERLEEAGCKVIYGFEDFKVHSKICLITKKERSEIKYITQVGSGNYNEKTFAQYTDLTLITSNNEIGKDANDFFKNMAIGNLDGKYRSFLVAPGSLKSDIMDLFDEEIQKGEDGRIFLKLNSLTDLEIIKKIKQASCAGVKVDMVIRGICCILPGIEGKTENVKIYSIVGRFLEHSRIYCFGTGATQKIFISSADFMTRNTERRVEVACPIYNDEAKQKIRDIIDVIEKDNVKSRILTSDGNYVKKNNDSPRFDSQQWLMEDAKNEENLKVKRQSASRTLKDWISNFFALKK